MPKPPTPRPIGQTPRGIARCLPGPGSRWREAALEGATLGVVAALLVGIAVAWYRTTGGGKVEPPEAMAEAAPSSRRETAPGGPSASPVPSGSRAAVGAHEPVATRPEERPEADQFAPQFAGEKVEPLPPARREAPRRREVVEIAAPAEVARVAGPAPGPVQAPSPAPAVVRQPPPRALAPAVPVVAARREVAQAIRPDVVEMAPIGPRPRPPAARVAPAEGSRCLVAGRAGEAVVARVLRRVNGRLLITMPDGSIGWAGEEVPTEQPFRPWTMAEASDHLTGGEYRGFRAVASEHYLVVTEGNPAFARRSADVLEELHRGLSDALREGAFDVRAPEFPLIVVVFRDRESFLAHRAVEDDVRAYYEAYSNRIFLYETSEREERAPDLAAVRKAHTVAHEGVHQYLQNAGVQPRLAEWPAWLVEGLAEYYAPPPLEPGEARARFGAANPFHMATLHDLRDPAAMWEHLSRDGAQAAAAGRRRPAGWIEHLVSAEALTPTDYALAWALTHYLAREHPGRLKAYIQALGKRAPLEGRSGRENLEEFTRAFHRDLGAMAGQVDRHLVGLPFVPIAFHAVLIERPAGAGGPAREALVSQSPAMIDRVLREGGARGGSGRAWTVPCFTRNQAKQVASGWLSGMIPPEGAVEWRR